METWAIVNQKGGVGKSTTALAIVAGLAMKGHRVLAVDLDAQSNLTYSMGGQMGGVSVLDALIETTQTASAIQRAQGADLLPGEPKLAAAEALLTETGKEYRLKEALASVAGEYDYCIIDTPPSLGLLTVNALTASTGAIIPAQADIFSLQGITQLQSTIEAIRQYTNPALEVKGIVLTRHNARTIIGREVTEMIEKTAARLNTKLFATRIREGIAIKEAQATRQSIYTYAPKSNAANDYRALLEEIEGSTQP